MVNLPKLSSIDFRGKRVLVRADLDINIDDSVPDRRLKVLVPTLKVISESAAQITIIAHKGRPSGVDESMSLKPFAEILSNSLGEMVSFESEGKIVLKENLRFDSREEANDEGFAKELSSLGDIYVNEAFGSSHRSHASIVGVPKFLPHVVGLNFESEVENLSKVIENPDRPLVVILSGVKKDKIDMIEPLGKLADKVLIAGRLPDYMGDMALESVRTQSGKVIIANLNTDKEDITLNSIERFEAEIKEARTIVLAGVIGKYEDLGHRLGTERIFKAVADSNAFKVVGGGDSLTAVEIYGITDKFNWISVGGGAMIELITSGTLPGIQALID